MLPNTITYAIAGLFAFIILGMVFINTVSSYNSSSRNHGGSSNYNGYDLLSSHAHMYTLPSGVKSSY